MKETQNRYFSYPGKELWEVKENESLPIVPLMARISEINLERNLIPARPASERRSDGTYYAKAFLYLWDSFLKDLEEKKLCFHTMGMSEMAYFTMTPREHMENPARYADPIDTLFVMVSADFSDPNYAMYAMERYRNYLEMAAKDRMILHFAMYNKLDDGGRSLNTLRESLIIHRFNDRRLYLDLSSLYEAGETLASIPGFSAPDEAVVKLGSLGIPALNLWGLWLRQDGVISLKGNGWNYNTDYNPEQYIASAMGRLRGEAARFYEGISDPLDPRLSNRFHEIGLKMDVWESFGERWVTFTPLQVLETGKKLPLVAGFYEMYAYDPGGAVEQMCIAHSFIDLAAQGEYILLLFAQEDLDDNDLLEKLIYEAAEKLPVDLSRVYVTGHSHNGRFTAEFTRRHQRLVAAAAPLGNEPGQLSPEWTSGFFAITDEQLQKQASVDTPIIMLNGYNETNCMYPLYTDAPFRNPRTPFIALDTREKRIKSWQRRLVSMNCPMKTEEEIAATEFSPDYVERKLGIPADKTEVLYLDGSEIYVADIRNNNGDMHFRVCAFQNCPHETTPDYAKMMWSFCRRFARDPLTGETKELYSLK